jgi:Ni,Fe-hydrogenase I large subunit
MRTGGTRVPAAAEANLMAVAHYLRALDWQREFIKMHAVLGGKNPHLQSFLVGGMATPVDPTNRPRINAGTIAQLQELIAKARDFVARVYIPMSWPSPRSTKTGPHTGAASANYHGLRRVSRRRGREPEAVPAARHHPRTRLSKVEPFDQMKVTDTPHSWYSTSAATRWRFIPSTARRSRITRGRRPPRVPRLDADTTKKYSWLKSPRYDGEPMEVGPPRPDATSPMRQDIRV